ncbi:hypothetical protein, partial [Pasteurella multocida]|uniref:hypothetical protein n=1 Tax=Pasteurella multocida TaxID=747 RepID=UPI001B85E360
VCPIWFGRENFQRVEKEVKRRESVHEKGSQKDISKKVDRGDHIKGAKPRRSAQGNGPKHLEAMRKKILAEKTI